MSSGIRLVVSKPLASLRGRPRHAARRGRRRHRPRPRDPALLIAFVAGAARRARRGSVCTGAFLLAEAGLLAGRRATTHWRACAELARRYPDVRVDPDPIFVRDGHVYTSAGVTAGMDLALALVEEDHGREVALAVARGLVLFLKRPGRPVAVQRAALGAARRRASRSASCRRWIAEHPARGPLGRGARGAAPA